jgi:outer membrane protein assembly factor BamB
MFKRILLVAVTAVVAPGLSCPPQPAGDNRFTPRPWTQAYSDTENSGFNAVHSPPAADTLQKWVASVGPLAFASPVIGPDGLIYVGNAAGELVALNPDGTEKWRRKIAQSILSSPAINKDTYQIIVSAQELTDGGYTSRLYRLDSIAALINVSSDTVVTSAAPKLWGNFVFLQAGSRLLLFDQTTLQLLGHVDGDSCFNLVCGGPVPVWDSAALNILGCVVTLGLSQVAGLTQCLPDFKPNVITGPIQQPSVAITDVAGLVGDVNKPIIVMTGQQCASAFRFYPAGDAPQTALPTDPHFELLWSHALVPVDCNFTTLRTASPLITADSQVIIGDQNGRVLSLDLATGNELWSQVLVAGGAVQCPPLTALRQIYVITERFMYELDSNGAFLFTGDLQGTGENGALSGDYVYVTTSDGVHTFTLDGQGARWFSSLAGNSTSAGISFPILGEDQTAYISSADGFVYAYR